MANKFVWSGASGANDGSSWADAYTSLMRDWGAEAGFTPGTDIVYVRSVHSESSASTITLTGVAGEGTNAPVDIRCVVGATTGTTPGSLATGATVTTTSTADILIQEKILVYGVDYISADLISIGTTSVDFDSYFEQCNFTLTNSNNTITIGGSGSVGQRCTWVDCDLNLVNSNNRLLWGMVNFKWIGGSTDVNVSTNPLFHDDVNGRFGKLEIENVDLSVQSGNIVNATAMTTWNRLYFRRCLFHASATKVSGTIDVPGNEFHFYHCQSGTDTDPAYAMEVYSYAGKVVADTASYRTGGASDGERTNPISWDMDTTVGSARSYPQHTLSSIQIAGWTDGDGSTAHTYRIYFASGGTQQDDDVWFDLVGPNDAATNSLGVRNTTRVAPEGTPANLTTDGASTWTGADVGTKQYMEIAYTPDKPGPISVIVHMATDSGATGHIYIDPKIYIDP